MLPFHHPPSRQAKNAIFIASKTIVHPRAGAGRESDLIVTQDWNGPNSGVILVRNSDYSRWLLQEWWDQEQLVEGKLLFLYEQVSWPWFPSLFCSVHPSLFCSVHMYKEGARAPFPGSTEGVSLSRMLKRRGSEWVNPAAGL